MTRITKRWIYLVAIAIFLSYYLWTKMGHPAGQMKWRALIFIVLVGMMEIAGAKLIKDSRNYHPAYALEKVFSGASFTFLGLVIITDLVISSPWTPWIWLGSYVLSRILAYEFILYRNAHATKLFVKTQEGYLVMPTDKECDLILDQAAAILRHGKGSLEFRAEVKDALDIPLNSGWEREQAMKLLRRRENR